MPDSHSVEFGSARLELLEGDITRLEVDALVNAANSGLLGGGGVDGAIHDAAGPELMAACDRLRSSQGGCATGDAVVTPGYRLRARHVFHAVGPIWHGGDQGEPELLAACYRRSLQLARELELRSVAFPAISTGVYGYPIEQAAQIALGTCAEALREEARPTRVVHVLFGAEAYETFARVLSGLSAD